MKLPTLTTKKYRHVFTQKYMKLKILFHTTKLCNYDDILPRQSDTIKHFFHWKKNAKRIYLVQQMALLATRSSENE